MKTSTYISYFYNALFEQCKNLYKKSVKIFQSYDHKCTATFYGSQCISNCVAGFCLYLLHGIIGIALHLHISAY